MPKSMLEQYLSCDKPPPLDKLNPYREVIKTVSTFKKNKCGIHSRTTVQPPLLTPQVCIHSESAI